jgi:diguanylate cyclase (GGDEF)-like protein
MPTDQLIVLALGFIVLAIVAGVVAYATAQAVGRSAQRRSDRRPGPGRVDPVEDGSPGTSAPSTTGSRVAAALVSPGSTRQVARVVAFLFLASVFIVVALTRAWPDDEAAIITLLAAGLLLVVLFLDMLPPAALGRARRPLEGVGAILFLGLLTALTGGIASPFYVGYFLVVAGTALSTEGLAPLAIAVLAAAVNAIVAVVVAGVDGLDAASLAWIGFNAVALILLADIAAAAARAQRQARDEALRASRFDTLTGLYNRGFFFTTMEQEIRRSDRMGRGFSMLMLDLDDLKPVNDAYGHQWGDRLLRAIADVIRRTIRFTDAAARYGGDEFVVLLPETDPPGAYVVAEKLRRDIAALSLHAADRNVHSSVSIGIVTYPADGTSVEQLVAAADLAMYESKRRGKNQIVGYRTRTERVATAIDIEAAELFTAQSDLGARTGGDPAPWSTAQVELPDRPEPPGRPPEPQRPIAPNPDAFRAQESVGSGRVGLRPSGERSAGSAPPGSAPPGSAPPGPPTPSGAGHQPADADPPWLTRTDPSARAVGVEAPPLEPPGQRSPGPPGADASAAPATGSADLRTGSRGSRSEEIRRVDERPWIALPIEPWEPPEPPERPVG